MPTITVRLTDEELSRLKKVAQLRDATQSDLVRVYIHAGLNSDTSDQQLRARAKKALREREQELQALVEDLKRLQAMDEDPKRLQAMDEDQDQDHAAGGDTSDRDPEADAADSHV